MSSAFLASLLVYIVVAIFGHIFLTRLRPGMAYHRDRRLAPLGLQFRHPGAAHDRVVLRRERAC